MKKINKILVLLLSCTIAFSCVSCEKSKEEPKDNPTTPTKTLTLNYTEKEFVFGESLSLIANYEREVGKTLTWTSTNPEVATVNNDGDVFSVSVGETDIIATYGDLRAVCKVKVGFGNLYPNLILENIADGKVKLNVGGKYALNGYVDFNDKKYRDISLNTTVDKTGVLVYNNGEFTALSVGETTVHVSTTWNNFVGATLQKDITVQVGENVAMNTYATVGGTTEITNTLHLTTVETWQGQNYDTEAVLNTVVIYNGEEKTTGVTYTSSDNSIVEVEDGTVKANGEGNAVITAKYTTGTDEYTNDIYVSVECPVVEYTENFEICTSEDVDVDTLFGKGAVILSAKQGGRELNVVGGKKIEGVLANGYETEKMDILSSVGGFSFSSVYAYDKKITSGDDFKNTFTLQKGKIIDGYFVLQNDITVDMTKQIVSFYGKNNTSNTYFAGIFDGGYRKENHTVNATVGDAGAFGGLGNGSIIKNTHFNFTFDCENNMTACGIAKNAGAVYLGTDSDEDVLLSNLKITTTNYFDGKDGTDKRSYSLCDYMNYRMAMKDIFVSITGASVNYTEYTQEVGALFHIECNSLCASTTPLYRGGFMNVQVVTGKFMPIANGKYGTGETYYTSYAQTDFSEEKTSDMKIVGTHSSRPETSSYSKIIINNKTSDAQKKLFGRVFYAESGSIVTEHIYTWVYFSLLNGGGINRYNTVSDLKKTGVTKVGSWLL